MTRVATYPCIQRRHVMYEICLRCAGPEDEPHLFDGRTHGTIVPARGDPGFGWDPIFQPDGFNLTFAEMEKEVKNTISHRCDAAMRCMLRDRVRMEHMLVIQILGFISIDWGLKPDVAIMAQ